MMAMSEELGASRPAKRPSAIPRLLMSILLGFVALFGFAQLAIVVTVLAHANLLLGPVLWVTTGRLVAFLLLFVAGMGGIAWLKPWKAVLAMRDEAQASDGPETLETKATSVLLLLMTLFGLAAAGGMVAAMLFNPHIEHPANRLSWIITGANLALFLLVAGGGVWGLIQLRPWTRREPMSPATRKTNALFGLSGLIATASCLAVIFSSWREAGPSAFLSNVPVPLWIALFAMATWLLAWAISWWWYKSADEHERRASDVGLLLGGFLFALVTPLWWVAARAGLLPEPDAMVLWLAVNLIWGIGWFWRRNR